MIRAGIYPDLLDEMYWWGADDLWRYAFEVLLAKSGRLGRDTVRPG